MADHRLRAWQGVSDEAVRDLIRAMDSVRCEVAQVLNGKVPDSRTVADMVAKWEGAMETAQRNFQPHFDRIKVLMGTVDGLVGDMALVAIMLSEHQPGTVRDASDLVEHARHDLCEVLITLRQLL